MNLKSMVEQNETTPGRVFDLSIQLLIIISLISFSIETLPGLSERFQAVLRFIEVGTVIIFSVEYVLRILISEKPLNFVFSFYGVVDLVAVLPFYIATGVDLRAIRAVRLLRLIRAFKLIRYSKAVQRFHRALVIAKEELILFFVLTLMILYFTAVGIYFFEHEAQPEVFSSVFHSMWWAIATLTTVGYGDVYPITLGGKIFTFFILMVGLGVVAVPTGLLASALSKARTEEDSSQQ